MIRSASISLSCIFSLIYAILNKEWTEQREQKPNSLGLCRVVTDMHEVNEKNNKD